MPFAPSEPWLTCWHVIPRSWSRDRPGGGTNDRRAATSHADRACPRSGAVRLFVTPAQLCVDSSVDQSVRQRCLGIIPADFGITHLSRARWALPSHWTLVDLSPNR